MTIMNLNALGMTLGEPLFSNLKLTINKKDRIGLVAPNGRGKTTLLGCLAGEIEPTNGDLTKARGLRVGYVKQNVPPRALNHTLYSWVLAALPEDQAEYESWRVDVILDELQVPREMQSKPLSELSGGWQRTALLAAAWVVEPDMLLLDEPTNHLDLGRIALLEGWVKNLPLDVPVIITSHDRAFLDATTNRTLFLRSDESYVFQLAFTAARVALDEADAATERQHANALSKAQQLRRQAAKLKNVGVNSGSDLLLTKTKQLAARAEKLEAKAKPAFRDISAGAIRLANSGTHAKALITLDDLTVTTPIGDPLYRTGKKWVANGDRVVLLGANGSGKTRLITRIHNALLSADTKLKCAASIVAAYSDQHISHLDVADTPFRLVAESSDVGDQHARSLLAGAGIGFQKQNDPIDALSGGQRARLAMLVLRLKNPNFYLLDEPTNHLDIEGQEALEAELVEKETTAIIVSHDRSFLRNVGNRFWWIKNKHLEEVPDPEAFLDSEAEREVG